MTASAHYLGALADVMGGLGFPADQALDLCGLRPRSVALKPSARIPLRCVRAMFEAAEAHLDDPQIGLRTGHAFRIAGYGKTGSIYAYADNLSDVVELNARYQRLAVDMGRIELDRRGETAKIIFRPYYEDLEGYRHVSAMLMGAYATAYRWLCWSFGADITAVGLPYAEPEDGGALTRDLLRCPVSFGHEVGSLSLSLDALSQPLPLSDAEKRARTVAQLDAMLGAGEAEQSFRQAVHIAMRKALETGRLNATLLAERMELSDAALRKRMREAGMSYRDELDAVRREMLIELAQDGESFARIAAALGYNDQAAFNRAFRRWYGVTPSQWTPPAPTG